VAISHLEVPQIARLQGVVRLHPFLKRGNTGPSEEILINCATSDLQYCTGGYTWVVSWVYDIKADAGRQEGVRGVARALSPLNWSVAPTLGSMPPQLPLSQPQPEA